MVKNKDEIVQKTSSHKNHFFVSGISLDKFVLRIKNKVNQLQSIIQETQHEVKS